MRRRPHRPRLYPVITEAPKVTRSAAPAAGRLIEDQVIDPGNVSGLTLPLDEAAEGCRAMDERRAIKPLLLP